MLSVRGYKESEVLGDDAIHSTLELRAPELGGVLWKEGKLLLTPFLFYDFASVSIKEPLPGQDSRQTIQGLGAGIRGMLTKYLEYEFDWGVALDSTDKVESGDQQFYFMVKGQF
jgi:hemolysin activation/secretion protein